ncbi:MAG: autotransporter-associated beta strand repeat-containing protein, partial [Prosthecobacter sp.]|nr:autotransporter-associated beta strand repeat-containing protein [Prosthecobacter sp.]
ATDLTISGSVTTTPGTTGVGLLVDGTGSGLLSGPVTLASGSTDGSAADFTKNGVGTWTIQSAVTVGDDYLINTGTFTVAAGGSLTWNATGSTSPDFVADTSALTVNFNVADAIVGNGTTNRLFARDGSTININANGALGASIEQIILGDNNQGIGNLVMNADATLSGASILQLGNDSSGEIGNITGTGTLSGLATINLNNGMVSANLAGTAGNIVRDNTVNVTLSGNNSLGTGTTLVREGLLMLDYTTSAGTDNKIGTGNLTLGIVATTETQANLTFNGNATAASLQTVANLASAGGPSDINLVSNGGQDMVLRVTGLLSRTNGTLNLNMPDASTRVEYTGATSNSNGIVGGWMTINNSDFAAISAGNLVAASYTTQNDASLWMPTDNITNDAGFTGTVDADCNTINSLRFDAPATSNITVTEAMVVSSGGIMVTSNVGGSSSTITGGSLVTGSGTFFFHQNSPTGLLTVASNLFGGATITKNGNGVLVLSGNNNTGVVNIDEGLIRVSGGRAISDSSPINLRNTATSKFEVIAGVANSETVGSLNGGSGSSLVTVGTGAVLTFNQTTSTTFAGIFAGAGTLIKNGAGILTVQGNATMTGPLIINGGRITMNGSNGAIDSNSSYTLNGAEFLNVQDQTAAEARLSDTGGIILNNTGGTNGLWTQRSVDSLATENVGAITVGAGHNVITTEATLAGNAGLADLVADTMNRTAANHPTVLVRGLGLGTVASGARRAFIRFDAGGQTAVNNFEVGGGGAAGSANISVIPWMIGDVTSAGLGNTFVTNIDGTTGLRPLTSAEYTTNAAGFNALTAGAASTNNVRFDTGATLTGTATAINSLVIDAATAQTVTGPANALEITTGALLAAGAGSHALSGFTELTTGAGRDYSIFVTNSATQNLTVNVPLTSAVPLVKSGAGILTLTNTGNAFTDVYLNQGFVAVDDLDKLGTGNLGFFGGGVRLAAGFADDLSTKTWNIATGGGFIDVSLVTAGATFANGIDDSTAGSGGVLNIITRGTGSTGTVGQLTIQGSSSFTGTVLVANTSIATNINSVVLNGDTNAAINGNLEIGNVVNINNTFDVVVALGNNEQIVDTASLTFRGASGENAYFKLAGFSETVAGIIDITANGVIENRETEAVAAAGTLVLNSSQDFSYNGFMRDVSTGTVDANPLFLTKQGTGTQTLIGANIRHSGTTIISGGTLALVDVTNWQSAIVNDGTLTLNQTTGTRTHAQDISGTGTLTKLGNGTLVLGGANTYSGMTRIEQGTLSFASAANLGDASGTNSIRLANGATLQSTGANVDLGSTRNIGLAGAGSVIEVTGTNILTVSGTISGEDCNALVKAGGGLLILAGANTYAATTHVSGGVLQAGIIGAGQTGTGAITVGSGATITGSGSTIAGILTVQSGGYLQAGDVSTVGATAATTVTSNSTLTFTQALTLQAGSITVLDITNSTNAGSLDAPFNGFEVGSPDYDNYVASQAVGAGDHDRLVFNNGSPFNPTIEAGAKIVVNPVAFTPAYGMIFNLMDWQGVVGFNLGSVYRDGSADGVTDDLDLPDISGSGYVWDVSSFLANGSASVVPEPGRMLLLFFGLLGLAFRRRRRSA